MTDIFGPTGRRRVRRALAAAVITAMALALFPGDALAVHDTGAFQLEGNAVTDPGVPGDDWDRVCHQVTGADCGTTSDTTASAVAWSPGV